MNDPAAILQNNPALAVRLIEQSTGLSTRAAVWWAADDFLSPAVCDRIAPRYWTGMLADYLERRFQTYGLASPPCRRTVDAHLTKWKEARFSST